MKKICLSDADAEFFGDELNSHEFDFFQKHKETFRCMWLEQGKSFWTRFFITFRSYTSKHGIIRDMPYESDRLMDIMDFAFIVVHEHCLTGKPSSAMNFLIDIARLAQSKDKLPYLDSKKFSKDPFYYRDTRDIFRTFFGPPSEKISYVKVYILFPVYLRLCGSVCRCLIKWMDAPKQNLDDDSYWTPPDPIQHLPKANNASENSDYLNRVLMCENCIESCGVLYIKETQYGCPSGPKHLPLWKFKESPRHHDPRNPLYDSPISKDDWRKGMNIDEFRDFIYYLNMRYQDAEDNCKQCEEIRDNKERMVARTEGIFIKKKKKNKKAKNKVGERNELEDLGRNWENQDNFLWGFDASNPYVGPSLLATRPPVKRSLYIGDGVIPVVNVHFGLGLSGQDIPVDYPNAGGVKVLKLVDPRTKCCETVLYVPSDVSNKSYDNSRKKAERFPGNIDLKSIPHLPLKFEWAEGQGWYVAVLNYESEEKDKGIDYTNFVLKVAGWNEVSVQAVMEILLKYIGCRKGRSCPGWTLAEDDIMTSVVYNTNITGITIIITKGINYRDCLTDWEKATERQIDLSQNSDEEVQELLKLSKLEYESSQQDNKKIDSSGNSDEELSMETVNGWKLYYGIVKRIQEFSESHLKQETFSLKKKKLIDIDVVRGKINFVLLEKDQRELCFDNYYCPRLDEMDHMYMKAWLKLEKRGIQSRGSAKELYKFILKRQCAAITRAEEGKKQKKVEVNIQCNGDHRIIMKKKTHYHGNSSSSIEICKAREFEKCSSLEMDIGNEFPPEIEEISLMFEKQCSKYDVSIKEHRTQFIASSRRQEKTTDGIIDIRKNIQIFKEKLKVNKLKVEDKFKVEGKLKVEDKLKVQIKLNVKDKLKVENKLKVQDNLKVEDKLKVKVDNDGKKDSDEGSSEDSDSSSDDDDREEEKTLRVCSHCSKTEPIFRTFKKCQRCQQEGMARCRFYCSRDCQVEDWKNKHRTEHQENKL